MIVGVCPPPQTDEKWGACACACGYCLRFSQSDGGGPSAHKRLRIGRGGFYENVNVPLCFRMPFRGCAGIRAANTHAHTPQPGRTDACSTHTNSIGLSVAVPHSRLLPPKVGGSVLNGRIQWSRIDCRVPE